MVAVTQRAFGLHRGEQLFQHELAFSKRSLQQAVTVKIDQIKNLKNEGRRLAPASHRLLQLLKTAAAGSVNNHYFTVEYCCGGGKGFHSLCQIGKLRRPILAVAAPESGFAAMQMAKHAVAVKFQLMKPLFAIRRLFNQGGKLRRN